jgi:hypothetical protein
MLRALFLDSLHFQGEFHVWRPDEQGACVEFVQGGMPGEKFAGFQASQLMMHPALSHSCMCTDFRLFGRTLLESSFWCVVTSRSLSSTRKPTMDISQTVRLFSMTAELEVLASWTNKATLSLQRLCNF